MERRKASRGGASAGTAFDAEAFLETSGAAKSIVAYGRAETIFTQGDVCEDVLYIQTGGVKLSVRSKADREAVVAILGPGDFFGEGCLAGQPLRTGTATAITPSVILLVGKDRMIRLLHQQRAMSDRFISHMLSRNIRIEADLIDQLLNSSEKRLSRALLMLARYGKQHLGARVVSKASQETPVEMTWMKRLQATPKPAPFAVPAEYLSLHKYLDNRFADTVVLTFAEIEDLLGFTLPAVARLQLQWWENADADTTPSAQSRSWIEASRTAKPNLLAQIVVFERLS